MKWYKVNPSVSPGYSKVLYDSKSLIGNRISMKIDKNNKRTEDVINEDEFGCHISDHWRLGYKPVDRISKNMKRSYDKAMDCLISNTDHVTIAVPEDDITQKLKMQDDYKNLSKYDFWIRYGL